MPLYVEVDHDGVTYRISTEDISDIHFWDGVIIDMSTPQYATESDLGGYARMTFGGVKISTMWLDDIGVWPPPVNLAARIYYSQGGESEKRLCWSATWHRSGIDAWAVGYDVYDQAFDSKLLEEDVDYAGDTVPMPMAIGTVTHMRAVRLADDPVSGNQRYHLADIQGTAGSDWHAFDDGVDICANVDNVSGNVFELTVAPVGEVTLSGTGSITTLTGLFSWACDAGRLNLTLNSVFSTTQAIDYEAVSQELLIDFLGSVSSAGNHLFYVIDSILMLCDLDTSPPGIATVLLDMDGDGLEDESGETVLADNDTIDIDPGDYLENMTFTDLAPKSLARCTWVTRSAVTENIGTYVKETEQSVVVGSDYPYGDEMDLECYSFTRSTISDRLIAALDRWHMPRIRVPLPMVSLTMLPAPGQRVIVTDDRPPRDLTIDSHVRSISYDFINMKVTIQGEGSLT